MELLARLAGKIVNNLVHSGVIKEEDAEIYIYGINQILTSVLSVSSALIIGLIFGVFPEIAVFMAAYIVKSNMVYTLCKHMVYMLSITNEHKK